MKFQYRIGTAVASTALVMNMLAPAAFADTTVEILGNGSKSNNTVNVTNNDTVKINQTNNLTVAVNITAKSNSGDNKANGNTGGDTSISTGNANATASLNVTGGVNVANVADCGCDEDTTVKVNNNGKKSKNKSIVNNTSNKTANQTANATVAGSIKAKAKSGKNKAKNNTNGTVDVETGDSDSHTIVDVVAPVNVLNPTP